MKVIELKEMLNEADENLEIVLFDSQKDNNFIIDKENSGKVTFSGGCDSEGNLLPDGNDEKYDVTVFMIQLNH